MRKNCSWPRRAFLSWVVLLLVAVPAGTAFADDHGGGGDRHRKLYIYELMTPLINVSGAMTIADSFGFTPLGQGTSPTTGQASALADPGPMSMAFGDASGHMRMLFADGSVRIFPDLTKPPNPNLPNRRQTLRMVMDFLNGPGGMQGGMRDFSVGEIVTLTEQPAQMGQTPGTTGAAIGQLLPAVQIGEPMDVLRTVEFVRQLDGLDVLGPTSILSVDIGAEGVAGGAINLRGIGKHGPRMSIISQGDATQQFLAQFPYPVTMGDDDEGEGASGTIKSAAAATGLTGRLLSTQLIYYEQGGRFIQPAYLFNVLLVGPTGARAGLNWLIPAVQDTPEPIINQPVFDLPDPFAPGPGTPPLPPACVVPDAIQFGRYLLRDDDPGWLRDAQGFGADIEASNTFARAFLSKPFPPTNDAQFFWNYPWLWVPSGVPPTDQSPSFPGSVHIALIEGHGLPWWISTEKNCCDVIDLTQITGFGGYHTPGELTDYVVWQSCSVVPAPGDPYGGNYASPASPFDVWFTIFQGLRGTYGYRSEMNIWNGVGMAFASDIGFGVANLSAWFTECSNNVFHHGNGWNYGSAVLISGQESDTLYDTCALPPPGSLTIWWQHP